jgi:hypothetical protein
MSVVFTALRRSTRQGVNFSTDRLEFQTRPSLAHKEIVNWRRMRRQTISRKLTNAEASRTRPSARPAADLADDEQSYASEGALGAGLLERAAARVTALRRSERVNFG